MDEASRDKGENLPCFKIHIFIYYFDGGILLKRRKINENFDIDFYRGFSFK